MIDRRALSVDEAVRLREASEPQLAPDGRSVAFVVAPVSKKGRHPRSRLFLVPSDASAPPHPLTSGQARDASPRFSPDGTRLAFTSDRRRRGRPALYLLPLAGGEARLLAQPRGEVSEPRWAPDGTRLAVLLKEVESKEEVRRKRKREDAVVVDAAEQYTRLWLVEVGSGRAWPLTPPGMQVWQHAWSPDGRRIAFFHSPTPAVNDYYHALMLSTLSLDQAPDDGCATPSAVCPIYGDTTSSLCWSPDGTRLAFIAGEVQAPDYLSSDTPLIVAADGGVPQPAVRGQAAAYSWVDWLSDDELIAAGDEGLGSVFRRIRINTGAVEHESALDRHEDAQAVRPYMAVAPPGSPRHLALTPDRNALVFVQEDISSPGDAWIARAGASPRRLSTLTPHLDTLAWSPLEPVAWAAPDGLAVHGLLLRPHGYVAGRRYPTVLHLHGGPAWLWSSRFYASWHDWAQLLAARGYAVLLPNPRGSTGRGTAFMRGNVGDLGGGEWADVAAGARWAVETGLADPERLGLGGWSWGGYLTAWGITQSDLFRAAVVGAGVTNLWSDHGLNNCPDMNLQYYQDLPYGDPTPYVERSPVAHARRVVTPTLILHGMDDEIVPASQARELYRALKTLGVPAQLVLYPREGHIIAERAHQRDLLNRVLDWFDRYLKP